MKHTPGPWTIEADAEKAGRHPLHDNRHVVAQSGTVCDLRDQPAQAADARLIAAAPDLLAALKRAARVFEDLRHCKLNAGVRARLGSAPALGAQAACYDAIAKAEEG